MFLFLFLLRTAEDDAEAEDVFYAVQGAKISTSVESAETQTTPNGENTPKKVENNNLTIHNNNNNNNNNYSLKPPVSPAYVMQPSPTITQVIMQSGYYSQLHYHSHLISKKRNFRMGVSSFKSNLVLFPYLMSISSQGNFPTYHY